MFDTYTIDTVVWTKVDRATLDPSVSTRSRVYCDDGTTPRYCKVKLVPVAGGDPDVAVFQVSTSTCDATGVAIANPTTGEIVMTPPRRLTLSRTNPTATVDQQLDTEIENEIRLYERVLTAINDQTATLAAWGA